MITGEKEFKVTGLMSGTSLDGLDIAACHFKLNNNIWSFEIEHASTVAYSQEWKKRLKNLLHSSARELAKTHFDYGRLIGEFVKRFHQETGFKPGMIASHGHTIFHDPRSGYTTQIGNGAAIAVQSGSLVVCDFRSTDVCLGGQGAPLVPIGDELLFGQYDACLNLGGFSNISLNRDGRRIAFDICPVNTVLNRISTELGQEFDKDGMLAASGNIIPELFTALNQKEYFNQSPPKSLSAEWLESAVEPLLLNMSSLPATDRLCTFTEHIALQIAKVLNEYNVINVVLSGGGAFNKHLVRRIREQSSSELIVPGDMIVKYKEALIFAFLGLLRWLGSENCLATATGAVLNSIGGAVYLPENKPSNLTFVDQSNSTSFSACLK